MDCQQAIHDIDTSTTKVALIDTGFTEDQDLDVFDNGANNATDPSFNELTATSYTAGFGGAGRKTGTISLSEDDANNRVVGTLTDLTWSALGGATNDTVGGAILIDENTNDTDTRLLAFFNVTDTPTNGSDFTLDFATSGAGGNLRWTT